MSYRARLKVRFGDIDHAGVVYYPRLLHYTHLAKEDFFEEALGIDYAEVMDRDRFGLPTVHLEADFRHPLRYGDRLEIEVRVDRVGRTSVAWHFVLHLVGREEPVAEVRTVTVGIDLDSFEKREVPAWLRERFAADLAAPVGQA